jgi:hypothetical protein
MVEGFASESEGFDVGECDRLRVVEPARDGRWRTEVMLLDCMVVDGGWRLVGMRGNVCGGCGGRSARLEWR